MHQSETINSSLWSQFGAGLDMLQNAIEMCPNEHWDTTLNFWYNAYHCIFWTDYFLSTEPEKFAPPAPFTFSEFDPNDKKPDAVYTKAQLLAYLSHCREKARELINLLTIDKLNDRWVNEYKNYSQLEVLLYNLRHIQHHAAQLNLLLRQTTDNAPTWVSQANDAL